jgi:hypothetical protein
LGSDSIREFVCLFVRLIVYLFVREKDKACDETNGWKLLRFDFTAALNING